MRVSEVSRNPWVWRKDPRRFRFSCRCCFTTTTHHCCNQTLSCVDILSWKINTKYLKSCSIKVMTNVCIRKNTWISYNVNIVCSNSTTRDRHLSWVVLFPEKCLQNSWNGYVTHRCMYVLFWNNKTSYHFHARNLSNDTLLRNMPKPLRQWHK